MARKPSKKNEQAPIEKEETPVVSDSNHTKASFSEVIARYKEQNPAKYEEKKDVLLAKLNALK